MISPHADRSDDDKTSGRPDRGDARSFVTWWFDPLREQASWIALAYLLAGLIGSVVFIGLVAAMIVLILGNPG